MKIRSLLSAAVALFILSGTVDAAKSKPEQGTISKVEQDSGKESGTITVKVTPKKILKNYLFLVVYQQHNYILFYLNHLHK